MYSLCKSTLLSCEVIIDIRNALETGPQVPNINLSTKTYVVFACILSSLSGGTLAVTLRWYNLVDECQSVRRHGTASRLRSRYYSEG